MKGLWLGMAVLLGCGDDAGAEAHVGDAGGLADSGVDAGGYEDASSEPVCRTHAVDPEADERILAALCVALGEPGPEFGCTLREDESAICHSAGGAVVVVFDDAGQGEASYPTAETVLATVKRQGSGFKVEWTSGELGECTLDGDVATLCVTR